jgi:hypothetical protein
MTALFIFVFPAPCTLQLRKDINTLKAKERSQAIARKALEEDNIKLLEERVRLEGILETARSERAFLEKKSNCKRRCM